MKPIEIVFKIAKMNNGMVTTSMLKEYGVLRGTIKYLSDNKYLEKVARGVYVLPGVFEDDFLVIQNRFKKGIFSLETALFLHGLTDRTPNKITMTFPKNYNKTTAKSEGIRSIGIKEEFYKIGIEEILTPSGNKVLSYNKERVLADILRPINRVDIQVVSEAFKQYILEKNINIPLLSKYSKIFGVEEKLKSYLEVLL